MLRFVTPSAARRFVLRCALPLGLLAATADLAAQQPGKKKAADPTPAAPGRDISYNALASTPRTPAEQLATFTLPPGFSIELVAAESEGNGKFIGVAWDAAMRLWTMTALEYPVDANENQARSDALFARGGRDRVLVIDDPYAPGGPSAPRVFADGLVMPLGVQPYRDGAFVQYGADIRLYRDTDRDGRADRHEVVLTGFGTQDSHLFPHQFLRQPGGGLFVAQGLFNYSTVRRPGGAPFADGTTEVAFNQCKLAWMALDGSRFESVTAGPNNIWGLTTSRLGETFAQEANDQGYPIFPYAPGVHVRTGSRDKLRPYQPLMPPPMERPQMGGTGLSGLALAEDADGFFARPGAAAAAPGALVFHLANPITRTLQLIRATPGPQRYTYERLPDFLTSTDPWFRPVAMHFGPDGALYIVDWYNRIISHNEIPRDHPDRDKTRGRIWRIRHQDQSRQRPPDLAKLPDAALLAHLGAPNALVARLAWLELGDRGARALAPDLARLAADRTAATDRRLGALWALENLQPVATDLLRTLAGDAAHHVRREAARIAAAQPRPEAETLAVLGALVDDGHPSVRAAVGDALRRVRGAGEATVRLATRLAREPLAGGSPWETYERDFERFLARWALETHASATRAFLASAAGRALPFETQLLATLAVDEPAAARLLAATPSLARPLSEDEIRVVAAQAAQPAVRAYLAAQLGQPAAREPLLRALLAVRTTIDAGALEEPLTAAALALLESTTPAHPVVGAEVAGAFKLARTEPALSRLLANRSDTTPPALLTAVLRALRELQAGTPDILLAYLATKPAPALALEAALALASSRAAGAAEQTVAVLASWPLAQRGPAIERLAGNVTGARALVAGLSRGQLAAGDLGRSTVEKLRTLLPQDRELQAWWERHGGAGERALRLEPAAPVPLALPAAIEGPFTLEAWFRLDQRPGPRTELLSAAGLTVAFPAGKLTVRRASDGTELVTAKSPAAPGVWNHFALTRDAAGILRLHLDGELHATATPPHAAALSALQAGPLADTAGWLGELRLWRVTRNANQIRQGFDLTWGTAPRAARPRELALALAAADWPAAAAALVQAAPDFPALLTPAEATARDERFTHFRRLARTRGEPAGGRTLFAGICLNCHAYAGKGGTLAPPLDGIGHSDTETLLRHILTPSAAMESAYRTYRVVTRDQEVHEGFLANETADAVVLRLPGAADRRIPRTAIVQSGYLTRSLMPEGLLDALPPQQVSDLFTYLRTLQ